VPGEPTILVTGFEPFGAHAINPSEGLAKAVHGRRAGSCTVASLVLPVHHGAVDAVAAGSEDGLGAPGASPQAPRLDDPAFDPPPE
jgi:hypothetical protein